MRSGHVDEHCAKPAWWPARRYQHRQWVCTCGRAWMTRWAAAGDSGFWEWYQVATVTEVHE